MALVSAIRYSSLRRQFKPNEKDKYETVIAEYPLVQYRLQTLLAFTVCYGVASLSLLRVWEENQSRLFDGKNPLLDEIHALSAGLKAYGAWETIKGIQECREACGNSLTITT